MEKENIKTCFNCEFCYNDTICVLYDDLIIGYCFMWKKKKYEE